MVRAVGARLAIRPTSAPASSPAKALPAIPRCRHGHLARSAAQAARLDGRPRHLGRHRPGGDGDGAAGRPALLAGKTGQLACNSYMTACWLPPTNGGSAATYPRVEELCCLQLCKLGERWRGQASNRASTCPCLPAPQIFFPWPANKLELIGGRRRAYIQENVSLQSGGTRPNAHQ